MEWSNQVVRLFDAVGALQITLLSLNLLLILFARKLVALFYHGRKKDDAFDVQVRVLRILNLAVLVFYGFRLLFPADDLTLVTRMMHVVGIIYFGYLGQHILQYFIFRRYGKKREIENNVTHIETYNTRFLSLLSGVVILVLVLLGSVHALGMDSLLEAGGVLGVMGVFLALTHAIWAPDIFSGLIILNSNMLEEGDVIELEEMPGTTSIVYKTRMFHTELLNVVNNHRIMLKNSRLRDFSIHNLSKFASARGLRERLLFNIGYDTNEAAVRDMFVKSYEAAQTRGDINIEYQYPLEIGVAETGDYAVQWVVYYYIKDVRSLIKTRMAFREVILQVSKEQGISLATPGLLEVSTTAVRQANNPVESGLT